MESTNCPKLVEREIIFGRITYFINFNISYEDGWYKYDQVVLEYNRYGYDGIIDALITYK